MRLEEYNQKINPNTSSGGGAQAVGNISAFGQTAESFKPVIDGLGDWKTLQLKKLDQEIDLQTMNAQTDYNKRMMELNYNKEKGLLNTELKSASGITQIFEEEEAKIREEVLRNLPYRRSREAFMQHADTLASKFNSQVQSHEREQGDKYRDVSFDNNINSKLDLAVLSYKNPKLIGTVLDSIKEQANLVYGYRGEEYVNNITNKYFDQFGEKLVNQGLMEEDYDSMSGLVSVLRQHGVSESILAKGIQASKSEKSKLAINNEVSVDIKTYGYTEAGIQQAKAAHESRLRNQQGNFDADKLFAVGNQSIGKPYVLGGDGEAVTDCGKFTLDTFGAIGIDLGTRAADGQYLELEKKGQVFTDPSQLRKGDLVFWYVEANNADWPPSDDPNAVNQQAAYKGISHVGIYDGNGRVLQAGSKGGVAYVSVDIYPVVAYGHVGGTKLSELEIASELQSYEQKYRSEAAKLDRMENEYIQQSMEQLNAGLYQLEQQGASLYEMKDLIVSKVGNDPKLQARTRGLLSSVNNAIKAEQNGGTKVNEIQMEMVKQNLMNGKSVDEQIKELTDVGLTLSTGQIMQINRWSEDRENGKGVFAEKRYGAANMYLASIGVEEKERKGMISSLISGAISEITRKENELGRDLTGAEYNEVFANTMAGSSLSWIKPSGDNLSETQKTLGSVQLKGENYEVKYSPYVLRKNGIKSVSPVRAPDGTYYVRWVREDNTFTDLEPETSKKTYENLSK